MTMIDTIPVHYTPSDACLAAVEGLICRFTGAHLEPVPDAPLPAALALVEKYRPRRLKEFVGQDAAVAILRHFLAQPHPTAFLLAGRTGTGKTSMALALANELGCRADLGEMGGLWQIPSGEQTAAAVRDLYRQMHCIPFYGAGWKVAVVNEADYMSPQAEAVWLDVLEHLPPFTVICFTTNNAGKLSARFRDRCNGIALSHDPKAMVAAIEMLADRIFMGETGQADFPSGAIQKHAVQDGAVSFRRVVQTVARLIATR